MTKKMRYLMALAVLMLLILAVGRPVEVEAMPRASGLYAWTTTDMCIRSNPGLDGNIVAVVPRGSELVVVATDDNLVDGFHWALVMYPEVKGYMAYSNEEQNLSFLEFQSWNPVDGSSGPARLLREVTLYSGPNFELTGKLAQLDSGETINILTELSPVKYGSNVCRVIIANGMEGYIQANNQTVQTYEYLGNPDSSEPAATAPTTEGESISNIEKIGIVNRPMCLRAMPSKDSECLRVADIYEELWIESLEVNASGENWYRVVSGTDEAYVAAFGVNVGGKTLDRDAETNTDLNLRSGPSTESQIWVTLPEGLPVWAMSEFDGVGASENSRWIRVAVDYEGHKYYGFVVDWGLYIQ